MQVVKCDNRNPAVNKNNEQGINPVMAKQHRTAEKLQGEYSTEAGLTQKGWEYRDTVQMI